MADEEQQPAAAATKAKPKRARKKRPKNQRAAARSTAKKRTGKRRGPGRPKGSAAKDGAKKSVRGPSKGRKRRTRYAPAERQRILAAGRQDGLTATQVQERFGVMPVTYYSWKRKAGAGGKRGRPTRAPGIGGSDLSQQLRTEVQGRIRQILPMIVRAEVEEYLRLTFGGARRGRPRG